MNIYLDPHVAHGANHLEPLSGFFHGKFWVCLATTAVVEDE